MMSLRTPTLCVEGHGYWSYLVYFSLFVLKWEGSWNAKDAKEAKSTKKMPYSRSWVFG
jgi:hypothetical protein